MESKVIEFYTDLSHKDRTTGMIVCEYAVDGSTFYIVKCEHRTYHIRASQVIDVL